MKITLSLSPAPSARDRYALAWAIPATVLGLALLFLLYKASLKEYHDFQGIEAQLADVQTRADDLRKQEASIRKKLEDPAYKDVLRHAQFLNKLIGERQLSLTQVSARVAGLLPEDAHLTGLGLSSPKKPGDDYMVRMGLTAKGEDAIETFINDLEDAPDFKDVSIINQGFQEESSQGQQVNLVCTARYLLGVDVDAETPSAENAGKPSAVKPEKSKAVNAEKPKAAKVEKSSAKKSTPDSKSNR